MTLSSNNLDTAIYNKVREHLVENGVKFKVKKNSMFMRFLSFVLFFNKSFMTSYYTTIGDTIYLPYKIDEPSYRHYKTLIHEYQHVMDSRNYFKFLPKFLFSCSYLLPQLVSVLAIFSTLTFVTGSYWFLLFLVFAVLLYPFNAYYRTQFELRGYAMNLVVYYYRYGKLPPQIIFNKIVDKFIGSDYYYMWDDEDEIRTQLNSLLNKLVYNRAYLEKEFSHLVPLLNIIQQEKQTYGNNSSYSKIANESEPTNT